MRTARSTALTLVLLLGACARLGFAPSAHDGAGSGGEGSIADVRPQTDGAGPKISWTRAFGGTGIDEGYAVVVDASGNVYVTGSFSGVVAAPPSTLTSRGDADVFIASFTAVGTLRWARSFGEKGTDKGYALALDPAGNLVVTGQTVGSIDFGGGAQEGHGDLDIFLASYTSDGAYRWGHVLGGTSSERATGVAVDSVGTIYLAGSFKGTTNLGGLTGYTSRGDSDAFIAALSGEGPPRWVQRGGGTAEDAALAVAVDRTGRVVVCGGFQGVADFTAGEISSAGGSDVFLASFGIKDGALRWIKHAGGTVNDLCRAVVADAAGHVLVAGAFGQAIDLGGGKIASRGALDAFVAAYTADGVHRWSRGFGGSGDDGVAGLGLDKNGNLHLTGRFSGTADLGGGPIAARGGSDAFVASVVGATGAHRWALGGGGAGTDLGLALALGLGALHVVGNFSGDALIGTSVHSKGETDVFVFKATGPGLPQ